LNTIYSFITNKHRLTKNISKRKLIWNGSDPPGKNDKCYKKTLKKQHTQKYAYKWRPVKFVKTDRNG